MTGTLDQNTLIPGLAEAIRGFILHGRLKEGEVIHQTELARELGVSAVPVREALRRLESEGLVRFLPYRGTIVAPVTALEVRQAFDGAMALALVMLPEALPRLTEEDFAELRALGARLDDQGGTQDEVLSFYSLLLRPAGMPWLLDFVRNAIQRGVRIFPLTAENRVLLRNVRPTRLEMVEVFASREPEASKRILVAYHTIRRDGLLKALAERE